MMERKNYSSALKVKPWVFNNARVHENCCWNSISDLVTEELVSFHTEADIWVEGRVLGLRRKLSLHLCKDDTE